MIEKKIHYIWFGKKEYPPILKKCLKSWKKYAKNFEIVEWNESNFDINQSSFTKKAYNECKWAFLSDYVRLKVLYEEGGIYLDTDMELLKDISSLLQNECFFGFEDAYLVNGAIIGAVKNHIILKKCLEHYVGLNKYVTIPVIISTELKKVGLIENNQIQNLGDIKVYSTEYFYPYHYTQKFETKFITEDTYSIHWWDASWIDTKKIVIDKIKDFIKFCLKTLGLKEILFRFLKK